MDGDDSDGQMPDLSMFEDSPAEEVEEEEVAAEPEEISIADMGLDALLAGSGFDGSEGKAESESNSDDSDFFEDFNQAENNSDANTNLFDDIDNIEELVELDESENLGSAGDIESFNNADEVRGNTYIWHIDQTNEDYVDIKIDIDKGASRKIIYIVIVGVIFVTTILFVGYKLYIKYTIV